MKFLLKSYVWLPLLLLALTQCQSSQNEQPDGSLVDTSRQNQDSLIPLAEAQDSLKLVSGAIPDKWVKIELGGERGFYTAFPRKPSQIKHPKDRRLEWKLEQAKYLMLFGISDLTNQESFAQYGANRRIYYEAILKDLYKSLEIDALRMDISDKNYFYWLDVYEALEATIKAPDFKLYFRCVVVGTDLFTQSFILWDEETPSLTQAKEQFFNAFSKEGYLHQSERDSLNQ